MLSEGDVQSTTEFHVGMATHNGMESNVLRGNIIKVLSEISVQFVNSHIVAEESLERTGVCCIGL